MSADDDIYIMGLIWARLCSTVPYVWGYEVLACWVGGVVCGQLPRGVECFWLLVPIYFRGDSALLVSRGGKGAG